MISVIVPVYNIENYVETCIQSVLWQTYTNFELLLVNDGSTDGSLLLCRKWEAQDPRIRVLNKENGGVSSARNAGLEAALGEYIFFLDGDDHIHPECFEKLIRQMSPEVDIVFSDYEEVNDHGFTSDLILQHKHYEGRLSGREAIEDLYKAQIYPRVIWGKLYRRQAWSKVRFNHMAYSEDTFAMFEILENTNQLYSVDAPLYRYLQRGSSASHQKKLSEFEDHTETLFHLYKKALSHYPDVRSYPAEEYIGVAYGLLKQYQQLKRKDDAMNLIRQMQFVYRNAGFKHASFSRRALKLPAVLFYYLILLKEKMSS